VSTSNTVVDAGTLSRDIVRDLIADGLQAWADDGTTSLADPEAGDRGDAAPFVMTSYPTQQTALYPHVIVSEASISATSFDNRHDLHAAEVSVLITVEATTSTEAFGIKDGVREYVIQNQEDALREGGFTDGAIDGSTAANWDDNSETYSWQTTISGTVYTA